MNLSDLFDWLVRHPDATADRMREKVVADWDDSSDWCYVFDELEKLGIVKVPIDKETGDFIRDLVDYWHQEADEIKNKANENNSIIYTWPAFELKFWDGADIGDWKRRWKDAGDFVKWVGALRERFIALRTSPIWQAIGDGAGGRTDTSGKPYPPYFLKGKCYRRQIPRERCIDLGIIDEKYMEDRELDEGEKEILEWLKLGAKEFGFETVDAFVKELEKHQDEFLKALMESHK